MRISSKIILFLSLINTVWAKVEVEPNWNELTTEKAIELLLSGQYDPNKISNGGDTVLHNAVKKQDNHAVKLSLFIDINPAIANKAGDTALHLASSKGDIEIIKTLITASAPLHWPNKKGDTPLHNAAASGKLDSVKFLVENGAPIDMQNALGQTPYHKALAVQDNEIVAYFIEQGYQINNPEKDIQIASGYAANLSNDELLEKAAEKADAALVKKLLINKDPYSYGVHAALNKAVEKGHLDIVRLLVEHGAGNYLSYAAAKSGKTAILAVLLTAHTGDINFRDEKGASALHYAVINGDMLAVKLLIEHGADVNTMSHSDWKRGSIPEDFWTSHDWDAWADADSALPHRFTKRQEGFIYPVISPLSLAIQRHPYNTALIDLLKSYGAREEFTDSSWNKKLRF